MGNVHTDTKHMSNNKLPSNGCPTIERLFCGKCLLTHYLAMGIQDTIYSITVLTIVTNL
jgi:hypothetical protein